MRLYIGLIFILRSLVTTSEATNCSWDPTEALLECNLSSESAALSLTKHQTEATRTLKLICSDSNSSYTSIRNDNYSILSNLQVHYDRRRLKPWPHLLRLHIEKCPLASLKGLKVNGVFWPQNGDVLQDILRPLIGGNLGGLRHISLTDMSIERNTYLDLSSSLWCEAGTNLISLNLSKNGLNQLPNPTNVSCQNFLHLEELILSDNSLSHIDSASGLLLTMASSSLTHLDVSRNRLQSLVLPSQMKNLKRLDVSDNKLISTEAIFEAVKSSRSSLQEIHAQGNQLQTIPRLDFEMNQLLVLNFSRNSIKSIEKLVGMKSLVAVDLSHNKLTEIFQDSFQDLVDLQVLNLAHNQIVQLEAGALASLKKLHVLILSHNDLDEEVLASNVLNDMPGLKSLNLDHNRLRNLPSDIFRGCNGLKDLSLAANFLRQWPQKALRTLALHLHTLDMGENSLRELPPLDEFPQLYGLRLAGNRLRNISENAFELSSHIKMLNLADNLLEHIDQAAFEPLKRLKALRLDNNRIHDLNGLLTTQHHLQWLNVSSNHLQWFDYAFIPKSVLWLSLRRNKIEELGNYYKMEGFQLTHLDIGHNTLTRLDRQALQPSLIEIMADYNQIEELAPNMLSDLVNLTTINLTMNQLETFPLSTLKLSKDHGSTQIWLANNPLECNCEMEWIQRINTLAATSPREFPNVVDWPYLHCTLNNRGGSTDMIVNGSMNQKNTTTTLLSHVRPSEFLCSYETHCFALCMCCDFFACDCRMKCSDGCQCFHDQTWTSNIIECGHRGHASVPEFIPMDATAVYLDGNNFNSNALINDEFIGRKHLTSLYLNNSQISIISNQTFKGLTELLVLHLEENSLQNFKDGQEFDELTSLRELYLHNNALEFIHEATLRPLVSSLQILTLHGNKLKVDFHVWQFMGPRLRSVSLGGNLWGCECEFVEKLAAFIKTNPGLQVQDPQDIQCFNETLRSGNSSLTTSNCADVLAVSFRTGRTFSWDSLLPVIAVTVAALIIVISLIILAVAARQPLKSWFQRRYDGIHRSTLYGNIKTQYDILLWSSPIDEEFVRQTILSLMEANSFRVAFHPLKIASERLPRQGEEKCAACGCMVVSQASYFQIEQDLVPIAKSFQDKPFVFIALDTASAKSLRRLVDLKGYKILLWDTKSFWPSLKAIIPNMNKLSKAVNNCNNEEDMWTYLKNSNATSVSGACQSGDSSLSTQSTDTMLVTSSQAMCSSKSTYMTSKRASTLRTSAGVVVNHQQPFQTMQNSRMIRPNIVENPLEEPIYHTLDDNNETVYINADLEVVYPLPEGGAEIVQGVRYGLQDPAEDETEAELNGLLADSNYDSSDYVPSPAPGSIPRYSSQLRRPPPQPLKRPHQTASRRGGQGYLV